MKGSVAGKVLFLNNHCYKFTKQKVIAIAGTVLQSPFLWRLRQFKISDLLERKYGSGYLMFTRFTEYAPIGHR